MLKRYLIYFGSNAIEEIEANPYVLIDLARGVDFKQVDKMALDLGVECDNNKRVSSGIKYGLIRSTYNGHTCVLKNNLIEFSRNLLEVSSESINDGLIYLNMKNEIVVEERQDGEEYVYLNNFFNVEAEIAIRIDRLQKAKNMKKIAKIEEELKKVEKVSEIELSEKQKQAVKLVNDNNVTIITGGPGTGKTTIIKTMIDIYEEKGKKVVLCAPTGRAAKRMTETTGKEASTLHRLLEIGKIDDESLYKNGSDYEGTPIDADLIIVDEMSMVDMFLMNYLLKSIYQGTKLILVGDEDQLASVGPGSVLKDLIHSNQIETIHLDKIFRQAAKSKIVLNAHRVNQGESFLKKDESKEEMKEDFFFIKGTKELNKALQERLNPNLDDLPEKASMGAIFRAGDRVMQIKNNYDIYWERKALGKKEMGSGVFNGEIGTIIRIDEKEKQVEIRFDDDKIAWYEFSNLDQIEHSYAITIHKSQRK